MKQDPVLSKLKDIIEHQTWHTIDQLPDDYIKAQLQSYCKIKDSLTCDLTHDIILKDNRILIPKVYQNTLVVKLAH